MRKEYVEYIKDLPINIYLANIMEYPIHWHDAVEILFVLKGSIDLQIETGVYKFSKSTKVKYFKFFIKFLVKEHFM